MASSSRFGVHVPRFLLRGQASYRGRHARLEKQRQDEAVAKLQERIRGNYTREVTDYELVEFRAAAMLQSHWCAHTPPGAAPGREPCLLYTSPSPRDS